MNLRNKKGSISIFVLVGLLFMTAFLIILFASNVNKSKVVQEQFNIISGIYSPNEEEQSYEDAYTALRKKNKQTLTYDSEKEGLTSVSSIELTKTFEETVSNYRIYGNEEGVGDEINLFDINAVTTFYDYTDNEVSADYATISDGVIGSYVSPTESTGSIYCNSNIKKLEAGTYTLSADVFDNTTEEGNVVRIGILYTDGNDNSAYTILTSYQTWERKSLVFTIKEDKEVKGFYFQFSTLDASDGNIKFKNIQLEKGSRGTEYIPYGKYRIKVNASGKGRNLFNIGSITDYTGNVLNQNFKIQGNTLSGIVRSGATSYFMNQKNKYGSGTYTISAVFSGTPRHLIFLYDTNGNILTNSDITISGFDYNTYYKGWYKDSEHVTLTIPDAVSYWHYGAVFLGTTYEEESIENIQIEEGSTVTEYRPYQNVDINLVLDSPLKKDEYIDFELGKIVRSDETKEYINLTELETFEDYTKIEVLTQVKPSRIELEYTGYTLD